MSKKTISIPVFNLPIFETHCHLDYLKGQEIKEVLNEALEHGVSKLATIAVSSENLNKVVEIANENENVYATQGIHPHYASEWSDDIEAQILKNITQSKVIAIGEIGLDYHYDKSPRPLQIEVFKKQLDIASKKNLPIIIHAREADEDTLAILQEYENKITNKVVLHSYTAGVELAKYAVKQGYFIGINGIITFKNSESVREVLRITPIENIVVETDAPFLAPAPFRGKPNFPKYLPFIINKISEIKEIPVDDLLTQLYTNSLSLFNLDS